MGLLACFWRAPFVAPFKHAISPAYDFRQNLDLGRSGWLFRPPIWRLPDGFKRTPDIARSPRLD